MPTVEQTILLYAPIAQVWERTTSLRDLPLWLDGVASVRAISTAQTQAGTTFEILRGGQADSEHWIVLDWQPQRSLRLTEYHQDRHLRLYLAPTASGTSLRATWEWRSARGLLQRLRPATAQRRSLALSLQRLASLINR